MLMFALSDKHKRDLSNMIKSIRIENNMSVFDMQVALNMSEMGYCKIEAYKSVPNVATLCKIDDTFYKDSRTISRFYCDCLVHDNEFDNALAVFIMCLRISLGFSHDKFYVKVGFNPRLLEYGKEPSATDLYRLNKSFGIDESMLYLLYDKKNPYSCEEEMSLALEAKEFYLNSLEV